MSNSTVYYYDFEHECHGQLLSQDLMDNLTKGLMRKDTVMVFEEEEDLNWLLGELAQYVTEPANKQTPEYNKLHYELCYGFYKGYADEYDYVER